MKSERTVTDCVPYLTKSRKYAVRIIKFCGSFSDIFCDIELKVSESSNELAVSSIQFSIFASLFSAKKRGATHKTFSATHGDFFVVKAKLLSFNGSLLMK